MKYGLIGERLSHSFSPELHARLAEYDYELCELEREELGAFMSARDFCGINVTMPYKASVIPYLDSISEEAARLGSVNTVVNRGGRLFGYNTDILGMRELISHARANVRGRKVLILGTGGTARTAAFCASDLGGDNIFLVSREPSSHTDLPFPVIDYATAYEKHSDADIIINATPVGMYPNVGESPIELEGFSRLSVVIDAIYNPLRTRLITDAHRLDIRAEGGLYMLVAQAVYASELFLDIDSRRKEIGRLYSELLREKENIVLIGMPTSGKTTVGRILSQELGREFCVTDDIIERELGYTISEYFEHHTEGEFRDLEARVINEVSSRSGVIISTGGGCILRTENIDALRSTGRIYFIDRSIGKLFPTNDRPLSRTRSDVERLYRSRYMIYRALCDVRIDGDATPTEVARQIREEFFSDEDIDT